ncbi:uncharacterized protein TNCV_1308971 [Trichonephila clavipes]|nr:uncharacterized protein TNCV_1308971 [Trichonephila clavipes]
MSIDQYNPNGSCGFTGVQCRSQLVSIPSCSKGRSYSTTSIPSSALSRRNSRERKTVCSLHPLTSAEIEAFHEAHAQGEDDLQGINSFGNDDVWVSEGEPVFS